MTRQVQTFLRLLDALRAVPGVEAATAMSGLPPHRPVLKMNTRIENATTPSVGPFHIVDYYQSVMPGYFETMGIPIVRGRSFQSTDTASSGLVVVVNERFADRFWKGLDPIGQRVKPGNDQAPWFTVVGVAKDVKQGGVDQDTGTELYRVSATAAEREPLATSSCARRSHQRHCPRRLSEWSVRWTPRYRSCAFGIWRPSLQSLSSGLASWRNSLGSLRAWRYWSPPSARMG